MNTYVSKKYGHHFNIHLIESDIGTNALLCTVLHAFFCPFCTLISVFILLQSNLHESYDSGTIWEFNIPVVRKNQHYVLYLSENKKGPQ